MHSEKLNKHINFLYSKGHIYQNFNDNVLFHGCIPMTEDGDFDKVEIMGKSLMGKELLDHIENIAHKAYFGKDESRYLIIYATITLSLCERPIISVDITIL